MAGLNILINKESKSQSQTGDELIFETPHIQVSKSLSYPHYPVDTWETDDFLFAAEGYFFEWENARTEIESFAKIYFRNGKEDHEINRIFSETDAEFILFVYEKTSGSAIVINDVLGRLPLYFCDSGKHVTISRNIPFIGQFQNLELNAEAGFEALTFGFTLGKRTLYRGIEKLPGGTIVEIENSKATKRLYHEFNYEELIDPNFDVVTQIEKAKSLFVEAVKNQSRFCDLNIVAMSGGLDSRAVAAGFHEARIPAKFISYSDSGGTANADLEIAKRIAQRYDQPLDILKIPAPGISDFKNLFNLKSGLSFLDMTFFAVFMERLSGMSERPAIFTGDGGDKVFPSLQPILKKFTFRGIKNFAILQNKRMSPSAAAAIMKQSPEKMEERLKELYLSYPEKDWNAKHVHFIMENRVGNWLLEGEDRNRSILSSFTPFYNVRLFKILMSAPDHLKKGYFLYNQFLNVLDPEVAEIPNANWGFKVSEEKKIRRAYLKEDLKSTKMGAGAKKLLKPKRYNYMEHLSPSEARLFEDLKSSPSVKSKFQLERLNELKYFDEDNFHHLLTLIMLAAREE